jgi:hypothetical protein
VIDELTARLDANLRAAQAAMDAAQAEPWVTGSTGQPKAHPGFAVAARCDEVALRLAVELRSLKAAPPPDGFDVVDGGRQGTAFDELAVRRPARGEAG